MNESIEIARIARSSLFFFFLLLRFVISNGDFYFYRLGFGVHHFQWGFVASNWDFQVEFVVSNWNLSFLIRILF